MYNPLLFDPVFLYYPWRSMLSEALSQGIIPLWNPYVFSGVPFLANSQTAVFYPLNLIFAVLSVPKAYTFQIIIHIMLAGILMYAYLRTIDVSHGGALLGGIVFMFNGFFIAWLEFATFLSTGIWIPLILLLTEKTIRTKKFLYAILTGISLTIMTLGGHMQIVYFIAMVWAFYVVYRIVWEVVKSGERKEFVIKMVILCGLIMVVWISLSAVQLIPTYEFSNQIVRAKESYESNVQAALPLQNIATFVFPDLFGNQVDSNFNGKGNYTEYCAYIGVIPLILTLLSLFLKKNKYTILFLIMSAGALLLAFGTPLYRVVYELVPRFNQMRGIGRFIYVYTFAGAVLSGLTVDQLVKMVKKQEHDRLKSTLKRFSIGHLAIGIGFAVLVYLVLEFRMQFDMIAAITKLVNTLGRRYLAITLAKGLFFYLAGILLLLLLAIKRIPVNLFVGAVVLLVVADLLIFGMKYNTQYDLKTMNFETPATTFISDNQDYSRIIRAGDSAVLPPNLSIPYKIFDTQGSDTYIYTPYVKFLSLIEDQSLSAHMNHIHNLEKTESLESPLLDLLGVKYIVSAEPITTSLPQVHSSDAYIYENQNVLPRAFIVDRVEVIDNETQLQKRLSSGKVSFKDRVILEESPKWNKSQSNDSNRTSEQKSEILSYSEHEIKLDVSSPKAAILVLSDIYYPGWKAYIDGKDAKIYRADYLFRAICVSAGRHDVVFRYEPTSYKLGLLISLSALVIFSIALVVLLYLEWRRMRYRSDGKDV